MKINCPVKIINVNITVKPRTDKYTCFWSCIKWIMNQPLLAQDLNEGRSDSPIRVWSIVLVQNEWLNLHGPETPNKKKITLPFCNLYGSILWVYRNAVSELYISISFWLIGDINDLQCKGTLIGLKLLLIRYKSNFRYFNSVLVWFKVNHISLQYCSSSMTLWRPVINVYAPEYLYSSVQNGESSPQVSFQLAQASLTGGDSCLYGWGARLLLAHPWH